MNPLFADQPTSIFERMSALARDGGAVNLGQGFPDFGWPEDVVVRAASALTGAASQYPPMRGLNELREAVAAHYRRHHRLDIAADHVTITSGATEALASSLLALIEPGDEVVLFQPLYDAYLPLVLRAGGVPRLVRLTPPGWRITAEALAEAFTDRTRLVLFNNPHNPTSRMFDAGELALLAAACVKSGAIALSDEVWEHVTFDDRRHIPLASLAGMAERTVKVGSAGKIFSLTGWKIGFVCAAPPLLRVAAKVHQFLTFTTAPNLQVAVAYGLGKPADYFLDMRKELARSRDRLTAGLERIGFPVLKSQGTYFLTVDLSPLGLNETDVAFCQRIVNDYKVAAIPVSAFYEQDAVTSVVRFCFSKKDATLDTALERLSDAVHRRKR